MQSADIHHTLPKVLIVEFGIEWKDIDEKVIIRAYSC